MYLLHHAHVHHLHRPIHPDQASAQNPNDVQDPGRGQGRRRLARLVPHLQSHHPPGSLQTWRSSHGPPMWDLQPVFRDLRIAGGVFSSSNADVGYVQHDYKDPEAEIQQWQDPGNQCGIEEDENQQRQSQGAKEELPG